MLVVVVVAGMDDVVDKTLDEVLVLVVVLAAVELVVVVDAIAVVVVVGIDVLVVVVELLSPEHAPFRQIVPAKDCEPFRIST